MDSPASPEDEKIIASELHDLYCLKAFVTALNAWQDMSNALCCLLTSICYKAIPLPA
jgi:hypothetical protein